MLMIPYVLEVRKNLRSSIRKLDRNNITNLGQITKYLGVTYKWGRDENSLCVTVTMESGYLLQCLDG